MKKSSYFGSITFLLGLSCFTLCAISLATTRWHYNFRTGTEFGLFESCTFGLNRVNCVRFASIETAPYVRATQAFMILSSIFVVLGTFLSLLVAFGKGPVKLNTGVGVIFLISGLCLVVASSVYTGVNRPILITNLLRFGYSLWMAWAATVVSFVTVPFAFLARRHKDLV